MKKIVRDSIVNEDIIDKVRERRFGIPDETGKDVSKNRGKSKTSPHGSEWDIEVYRDGDYVLVKNPWSLDDFGPDVRGVIVGSDFYIENIPARIHEGILDILEERIGLELQPQWHLELPKGFLTVQRFGETKEVEIGESNENFSKNGEGLYVMVYTYVMSKVNKRYQGRVKFVTRKRFNKYLDDGSSYDDGDGDTW